MKLVLTPMVHVMDMKASVAFFEALGAVIEHGSPDGDYVQLTIGQQRLSLLAHPLNPEQNEGRVELNFDVETDIDDIERELSNSDIDVVSPTNETGFGRQLQITSPDGLLIKINHIDPAPHRADDHE